MQTLRVEELSKTYGEKTLFKNLNFMINEHDRIGLIGTNGSGKTSLLNVLTGVDSPDSGQLITPHDYRISYLKQTPELDEQATIITAVLKVLHLFSKQFGIMKKHCKNMAKIPKIKKSSRGTCALKRI